MRVQLLAGDLDGRQLLIGEWGNRPIVGRVLETGRLGDLIGTYWAAVLLISNSLRSFLQSCRFTGWEAVPVVIDPPLARGRFALDADCKWKVRPDIWSRWLFAG